MDTPPLANDDASLNTKETTSFVPPDPEDMNNKRAAAAERALLSFSADFGELVEGKDFTSQNLGDLLADLAHMCDRKGLEFGELLEKAAGYYSEETNNQGRQFMGMT